MAKLKSKTLAKGTTPVGRAVWPYLHEPNTGEYAKEGGSWETKLVIEAGPEADKLEAELEEAHKESIAYAQAAYPDKKIRANDGLPFSRDDDGNLVLKFWSYATGKYTKGSKAGQTFKIAMPIYDAFGQAAKVRPRIGGGSLIKVAYEIRTYYTPGAKGGAGIRLNLLAVQVIKLVEYGERDAASFGFGKEEGGFNVADITPPAESGDDLDTTGEDDDEGDEAQDEDF